MRLKLNRTLRAALIAAISAAGFTLPQAFAETATGAFQFTRDTSGHAVASVSDQLTQLTIPWSDSQSGSFTAGTMADGTAVTGTWSSGKPGNWQGAAWTNEAALTDLNSSAGINLTTSQVSNLQSIGAWGGGGNTNITLTLKDGAVGQQGTFYMFTSSCDFTPTGFGVTGLSNTTITCASATGNGWDNVVTEGAKNLVLYKVTGTINAEQVTFTNSIGKNGWSAGAYTYNIGAFTAATWQGTLDDHNWADSVWDIGTFPEGGKAVFGAEGYNEVTISSAITAASVSVSDQEYTFEIEDGGSLTAQNLTVDDGASLNLTGEGTYTVNKAALVGDLAIGKDTTLKVVGADAAKTILGSENVTNSGTVEIGDSLTIDGSLTSKLGGTVAVAAGKKLTLGTTKDSHTIDLTSLDALVLGQGANIDTKGLKVDIKNLTANGSTLKMLDTKDKSVDGVLLHGTTTLAGDLTVTSDWKYKINIASLTGDGTLTLTGGNEEHRAVIGNASNSSINVTNKMTNVELTGSVTLGGTLTVNGATSATGTGPLTVGGLNGSAALNVTNGITFTGDGTYSFTGALTVGGKITKTGAGTQTISGYAMHQAIDVQAGTLVLSGTYAIDALEGGDIKVTYVGGQTEGNGFSSLSGTTTVYTAAAGSTVNAASATFTIGGSAVEVENGVYTAAGDVSYDTFYVKSGTESLGKAIDYAAERGKTVSTVAMSGTSTITMDRAGASVGLTLAEGAAGTVDTTVDTALAGVSGAGALVKTGDATLTLGTANTAFTGNVTISGGTVKIGNNKALGEHNEGRSQTKTITIAEGGTLDLNGITDANFKYTMSGGTLTNSGAALGYGSSQTTGLDLTADSTVHADSGHDLRLLARGYAATALNLNNKTLTKTGTGLFALKNTTVSAGTIEVQGGQVDFQEGSSAANITLKGGTLTGTMNVSANIAIDAQETTATGVGLNMGGHNLALNVAEDKELTLTGTISNGASYTKGGAGTLNLGELGLTSGSFAVNEGTVNLESATKTGTGAYTLSGDGTVKLGLYGIDLQAGSLAMSGHYDISDVYVDGDTYYDGGVNDGNGFAVSEGSALVVTITDGATLATTGATFKWNGADVTVDDATGTAAVEGKNYGSFYIFTASETVTQARGMEREHGTLSSIYVEAGATLDVDQDINGSLVDTWSTGTVNINRGKTVTGTMEGVALAGSGTYDLGSMYTLGDGTTLGDGWTGTVKVSDNGNATNLNLASLGHTGSTVELNGVTGWLSNDGLIIDAAVKLSGAGLTINNGSSNKTIEFAGGVKGEGDLVYTMANGANNQTYIFSGDVSEWYGSYKASGEGKTSTLQFYGDASDVCAAIVREKGTLNLVVGNGSDVFDAVFSAEVSVSSVNVKANASATFLESTTATTVTNAGTVMFSTLEGLTQAITNTGDVIFNSDFEVTGFQETSGESGYFDLGGTFSTDGNGYAGTSDSYLTIVDGGTVEADNITVTQGDDTYKMNNSGLALKGDGDVDYDTFYVNSGTVDISDVNADGRANYIEVSAGTLNVDEAGTGISIMVTDTGTLTGDELNFQEVGIAQYATASFAQGIHDDRGVEITSDEGTVDVMNIGSFTQAYTLEGEEMVVTAQSIVRTTDEEDITVSNWLNVEDITNVKSGKLTLEGQGEVMTVNNITIGPDSTVEILYQEENKETTVTVTETLAAGNGTLLANLVMADDSALLVGGVERALHVGSTITMGANLVLDGLTLQALDALAIGDTFWLIDAAAGRDLDYTGAYGVDAWYDGVFSRVSYEGDYTLQGDFNIMFDEVNGYGLRKFSNTPEPTTGTLSLLALAALAARRRKHN